MAKSDRPISTPEDLRAFMRDHDLTQPALAALVYVSERQVRNWLSGDTPVPPWALELARFKVMVRGV